MISICRRVASSAGLNGSMVSIVKFSQDLPTNPYGRYHHLRDVARKPFDTPRPLDSGSVMSGVGSSVVSALTGGRNIFELRMGLYTCVFARLPNSVAVRQRDLTPFVRARTRLPVRCSQYAPRLLAKEELRKRVSTRT